MKLLLAIADGNLQVDLSRPIDISIPVQRSNSVSSFQIASAQYRDYEQGGFIGNVHRGGSCNLETITFTPHGNGTHTECIGHIAREPYLVNDCILETFYPAQLISTGSISMDGQAMLDLSEAIKLLEPGIKALVIRSTPNDTSKRHRDYSGQPTPAIHPDHMKEIVGHGIEHLLVDLPSVDPEWDGGALASHHIYWQYPEAPRTTASITEFIFVPEEAEDGLYGLQLQIANFASDASPSKPYLYPRV